MRLAKKGYLQSRNQTKTRLHFRKTKRSLNLSKRSLYGNVTFCVVFSFVCSRDIPVLTAARTVGVLLQLFQIERGVDIFFVLSVVFDAYPYKAQ